MAENHKNSSGIMGFENFDMGLRGLMVKRVFNSTQETMSDIGCHPLIMVTCCHGGTGKSAIVIDSDHDDETAEELHKLIHDFLVAKGCKEGSSIQ